MSKRLHDGISARMKVAMPPPLSERLSAEVCSHQPQIWNI